MKLLKLIDKTLLISLVVLNPIATLLLKSVFELKKEFVELKYKFPSGLFRLTLLLSSKLITFDLDVPVISNHFRYLLLSIVKLSLKLYEVDINIT